MQNTNCVPQHLRMNCMVRMISEGPTTSTMFLDLQKAFENVQLAVVWTWATHNKSPTMILRFARDKNICFECCVVAKTIRTSTGMLLGMTENCDARCCGRKFQSTLRSKNENTSGRHEVQLLDSSRTRSEGDCICDTCLMWCKSKWRKTSCRHWLERGSKEGQQ